MHIFNLDIQTVIAMRSPLKHLNHSLPRHRHSLPPPLAAIAGFPLPLLQAWLRYVDELSVTAAYGLGYGKKTRHTRCT